MSVAEPVLGWRWTAPPGVSALAAARGVGPWCERTAVALVLPGEELCELRCAVNDGDGPPLDQGDGIFLRALEPLPAAEPGVLVDQEGLVQAALLGLGPKTPEGEQPLYLVRAAFDGRGRPLIEAGIARRQVGAVRGAVLQGGVSFYVPAEGSPRVDWLAVRADGGWLSGRLGHCTRSQEPGLLLPRPLCLLSFAQHGFALAHDRRGALHPVSLF